MLYYLKILAVSCFYCMRFSRQVNQFFKKGQIILATSRNRVQKMTHYALFISIILLLGISPIGFLVLPFASITFVQIPVIIGGAAFGWRGGLVFGFTFGLVSLIRCFLTPDAVASIVLGMSAYNLLLIVMVLFLPRVLTGLFSALVYRAIPKKGNNNFLAAAVAGLVGSLTNTVFVIGGLYFFAYDSYTAALGVAGQSQFDVLATLMGVVGFNGLIEAAMATLLCGLIGRAISPFLKKLSTL